MNDTKRKPVIQTAIAGDRLMLEFGNNDHYLTIAVSELSPDMVIQAALHGLKQKLCDAAAISRDPDTGRSATVEDKYRAVRVVFDRISAGEWNATRAGGEGTGAGGLLFRALRRLYPQRTEQQLVDYLAGKTKAEQAALRLNPKVAAIIDTIKAESAKTSSIDTDALLDDLA